jgi:serine beta-lactamase-like protein LACTB, mitochondrial
MEESNRGSDRRAWQTTASGPSADGRDLQLLEGQDLGMVTQVLSEPAPCELGVVRMNALAHHPLKAPVCFMFTGLLFAFFGIAHAQAPLSRSMERQLDQIVSDTMRAQKIPAITVALVKADRLIYSKGFGTADIENSVPATNETLIRTGSIAKPITAVAAMTLVESGKLNLDAPIQEYCPAFPMKQSPITTRELLSHTSGIRHYRPEEVDPEENTHHYRQISDALKIFGADPLLFPPGTSWHYSTYGYTVVGCVIEGAARERLRDYVAEHVLKPAGMTHTFVDDVFQIVPHRGRGYQKINGQVENAALLDSSYKIPGGGYVTSAEDLVRFAQALLDNKLLKPKDRSDMWTASKESEAAGAGYGLGFGVIQDGKYIWHTGSQAGASTDLLIIPAAHFAVAVMANMDGVNAQVEDLARAIVEHLQLPYPKSKT